MIPEFITADYIEECRKARFCQGWWAATWLPTKPRADGRTGPSTLSWPSAEDGSVRPPWALPPVVGGGFPQTNVRTGDLCLPRGLDDKSCVGVVHARSDDGVRLTTVSLAPYSYPQSVDGMVFLPRLDQLLWMAEAGRTYHGAYLQVAFPLLGTISPVATLPLLSDAREVDWRGVAIDMILHADRRLKALGGPAREV